MIRILRDEKLRDKLSKNVIEWSKKFSWDKSAKEFMKTLESIVSEQAIGFSNNFNKEF